MKCIFCEADTSNSKSVEHIIPESLGNQEHVLPVGFVCDKCNNYFAVKVERPLLESAYFTQLRQRQGIMNKKGRLPAVRGILPSLRTSANIWLQDNRIYFAGGSEAHTKKIEDGILGGKTRTLYVPVATEPKDKAILSRFLAKVSLETMAIRLAKLENWQGDFFADAQISALRRYARRGDKPDFWSFHERQLYHEDHEHNDGRERYQVLHEWDFLRTGQGEMYCVVCIFGREFAFNIGGPDCSSYARWLDKNGSTSPLYQEI
tara:strand:+ start:1654 stop:2439 length:786 start_codon:yes stop_codon:yes gene_type:complete